MATMYSMYADIGIVSKQHKTTTNKKDDSIEEAQSITSLDHPSHVIFTEINFHKAHTGLFAGVIVLAGACVSIILFFSYLIYPKEMTKNLTALMIYQVSEIILHGLLIVFSMIGWLGMRRLSFKLHGMTVDEVLLLTSATGFILFEMFRIQPFCKALAEDDLSIANILTVVSCLIGMLTCVIQTGFVFDSLTRYCKSSDDLKHKPGRGSVTFLLICNLAVWVFKTFQMKEIAIENAHPLDMYGFLAWSLIAHACIPLLMFYHYHCSACLAHVWGRGYHVHSYTRNAANDSKVSDRQASSAVYALSNMSDGTATPPIPVIHLRSRANTTSVTTATTMTTTVTNSPVLSVTSAEDANHNVAEV